MTTLTPLNADLHIHSLLSPCAENAMTPESVVKKLMQYDIDVFSITDHNSGFNARAFGKAAKQKGILFIPGIELQSSEEIHLLGYFPDIDTLDRFCEKNVQPNLMHGLVNDPEGFGNQIRIDESGNSLGEVPDMLSMPLNLTMNELVALIHNFDGVPVPAHLDRGMSVISQLGYIPPDLPVVSVEIWDTAKIPGIMRDHLDERGLRVLSSSDTHHLETFKMAKMKLWVDEVTVRSCLACLRGEGRISIKGPKTPREEPSTGKEGWKSLYG